MEGRCVGRSLCCHCEIVVLEDRCVVVVSGHRDIKIQEALKIKEVLKIVERRSAEDHRKKR